MASFAHVQMFLTLVLAAGVLLPSGPVLAQQTAPVEDVYREAVPEGGYAPRLKNIYENEPPRGTAPRAGNGGAGSGQYSQKDDVYRPIESYNEEGTTLYRRDPVRDPIRDPVPAAPPDEGYVERRYEPEEAGRGRYDRDEGYESYERLPPRRYGDDYDEGYDDRAPRRADRSTYSEDEILRTGHKFFGSVSKGLASVVEYAFQQAGRPNGYILGEDAGGAFVAGLRYGEGTLYMRDGYTRRVYWQGPSLGYDFGAEGSKTMVLVYNLRHPDELFARYGGVQGSAYLVGGVGIQFQKRDNVTLAPIRSGLGVRLGANVGYLKYTRRPTWNPF